MIRVPMPEPADGTRASDDGSVITGASEDVLRRPAAAVLADVRWQGRPVDPELEHAGTFLSRL